MRATDATRPEVRKTNLNTIGIKTLNLSSLIELLSDFCSRNGINIYLLKAA
jgi:hypothetical protein